MLSPPPDVYAPHQTHMPCQLATRAKRRGHALPFSLFTSLMKLNNFYFPVEKKKEKKKDKAGSEMGCMKTGEGGG